MSGDPGPESRSLSHPNKPVARDALERKAPNLPNLTIKKHSGDLDKNAKNPKIVNVNKTLTIDVISDFVRDAMRCCDAPGGGTITLGVRVRDVFYIAYRRLDPGRKRLLKRIVEEAIRALYEAEIPGPEPCSGQGVVVNMPISVSIAESRASATASMDPEVLRQQVDILKDENRRLKEVNARLRRELDEARERLERLEAGLQRSRGRRVDSAERYRSLTNILADLIAMRRALEASSDPRAPKLSRLLGEAVRILETG